MSQKTAQEILLGDKPKNVIEFQTGDPEFGDGFLLVMSGSDASMWSRYQSKDGIFDDNGALLNPHFYRAKLVQLTWCDKDGKLVFSEGDVETIANNIRSLTINMIFTESVRINGLSDKAVQDARESFPVIPKRETGTGLVGSAVVPILNS